MSDEERHLFDRFWIPGWYNRIWPRIKRWGHCLRGTFSGHRMVDITERCVWYNYPLWIGCECGKAFWWDPSWPALENKTYD